MPKISQPKFIFFFSLVLILALAGSRTVYAQASSDGATVQDCPICSAVGWDKDSLNVHLFNNDSLVGIGTNFPVSKLQVVGTITTNGLALPTGAQDGYFLMSDALGNASWQPVSLEGDVGVGGNLDVTGDADIEGSLAVGDATIETNVDGDLQIIPPTSGIVKIGSGTLTFNTLSNTISTTDGVLGLVGAVTETDINIGIGTDTPQSALQIANGYIQIPTTYGPPPSEDCDADAEAGRLNVDTEGFGGMFVCLGTGGWKNF